MWREAGVLLYLTALSLMDIRERKIRIVWLAAGVVVIGGFFVWEGVSGPTDAGEWLVKGLLGTLPGLFLLAVARITGKAGYGDGLVMIVLGVGFGYLVSVVLLCVSLFLLSLCSIALLLCRRVRGNTRMPYLPFLTAAYLCALCWNIV